MKKLLSVLLIASLTGKTCYGAVPIEQLEEAIAKSRVSRVKTLLHKTARESMSEQARLKLLGNLYDTAAELTDKRIDSLSLIGNWRDAAKTFFGAIGFGVSAVGLGVSVWLGNNPDKRIADLCWFGKIATGLLLPASGYMFYKGFTCSTQRGMIAQAVEVEEYLDSVLNNAELLDDETVKEVQKGNS